MSDSDVLGVYRRDDFDAAYVMSQFSTSYPAAWVMGLESYEEGEPIESCPFGTLGTRHAWRAGWKHGKDSE